MQDPMQWEPIEQHLLDHRGIRAQRPSVLGSQPQCSPLSPRVHPLCPTQAIWRQGRRTGFELRAATPAPTAAAAAAA
eukprot:CAMPEP_0113942104 /NCGR_PEP_ID=MMETSP1339-20121228/7879_1 /TAXON_ID=94617 /ORGANISM="Fibrocapsa japonica" /LENGTH=76 /DNA_ID=CAMNT_0000946437 /DNA_START=295 /DNA_END=521 /DNA_ORIENTATION=- /assembly_acc=CAM_ASM_000762